MSTTIQKSFRQFAIFLIIVDFVWLLTWFGTIIWFEAESPNFVVYRHELRDGFRHHVCTLALVYFVVHYRHVPVTIYGFFPFTYALLDDLINVLDITRRADTTESAAAWYMCVVLLSISFAVSVTAFSWYSALYSTTATGQKTIK